ncbi:MAG: hypothetical protein KGZ80_02980 [Methylomonas sp.]|nr:hypothetical protein [Methylomonas sp.]
MKRIPLIGLFALLMTASHPASAHERLSFTEVLADVVFYRPAGLALTALGVGLFAATSPMLLVADQVPPHDALDDAVDVLVMTPYRFTFQRPIGALRSGPDGVYHRR